MLNPEQANALAHEWLEAWNAHDLERILSHYHSEVEFTSPFVARLTGRESGTLHGISELRDYFTRALAAYPDLDFRLICVLTGASSVAIHYHSVQNLLAAETMELDGEGRVRLVLAHYGPAAGGRDAETGQ